MKRYRLTHFTTRLIASTLLSGLFLLLTHRLAAQTIFTVAGSDSRGDGDQATSANLYNPSGVVTDGSGNLFIADQNNNRIRKVTPDGIITTVVGTGSPGFSGDGGPATSANLNNPSGVTLDNNGNLFITDQNNNRIRKVSVQGVISTVAGNGSFGFGGDGGPAVSASLSDPRGVAVDGSGNLFIADNGNRRIRKVAPNGIISTVAGSSRGFSGDGGPATSAKLNNPTGVAVDGNGNLFIADYNNKRIRRVALDSIITTITGNGTYGFSGDGGPATNAGLSGPSSVVIDNSGNLFIADQNNQRIRRVVAPATVSPANLAAVCSGSGFSLTATVTGFTPTSYTWSSQPVGLVAMGATPSFSASSISSPTPYTLTVTASNGTLSTTGSVTLLINAMPTPTLLTSGTLTCAITSVTLTAGGGDTYTFSGPGLVSQNALAGTAVVSMAGIYSATVTNANGCTATQITSVDVDTTPPTATLTNNGPLSCIPTSLTLTAGNGISYNFAGPGLSQNGVTATAQVSQAGTYSVIVTGANGCTASAQTTISFSDLTVGIIGQPAASSVLCEGSTVSVSVSTSGLVNAYQWYKNGPSRMSVAITDVASATTATLTLPNVTMASSGSYSVVVVGSCNSLTSTAFTLTINSSVSGLFSLKTGTWDDPSVWSCNRVPLGTDSVRLKHVITIPSSYTANAQRVSFDLGKQLKYELGGQLKLNQ